ncbi:MAG: VOC family protein [Oscillospiraceae bacterium]|nr:VOC family protein [Oscillospiraceae bacterium]
MTIIPTFHCGGRCAEAIALYQEAFGLEIDWQGKNPETGLIYHTEAHIGSQRLRLSDGGVNTVQADSLFLAVTYDTVDEVIKAFDIVKEGGIVVQSPHKPDFATCMSEVKDKFGFKWFLMVD